jgi:aerobic-type carbon monoxide dehydrogenase small subunit (CoxS/CutS family)
MIKLRVNGTPHQLTVDPETPLLWVIREQLGLTGTKYSCGISECGACTVHIDGEAVLSCETPVGEVAGSDIVTIEGFYGQLAETLRRAWIAEDVAQCGYCQPGQIMTAAKLLEKMPQPTDEAIDDTMSMVSCRCGTYPAIRRAIHRAAGELS